MHKQLLLLHNAIAAYFSGNAQALEGTLKQFNIRVSLIIIPVGMPWQLIGSSFTSDEESQLGHRFVVGAMKELFHPSIQTQSPF